MIAAIVYNSTTGSCKHYADELSRKLHIPCYPMNQCPTRSDGEFIFVSWIMAGSVVGYKKAAKKFNLAAVVAVGMAPPSRKTAEACREKADAPASVEFFSVQGGFNINKLPAPMKLIMKWKTKDIARQLEQKKANAALSPAEDALLKMARSGQGSPASWDVSAIVAWAKKKYDMDGILHM